MKILAVDDDSLLLELMQITLNGAGFNDVTLAQSADEALQCIAGSVVPFECILLDIQMPGTDGIELCARIRKMHQYRNTPILMITAMTERTFVERAFAAGANDYVSKPFDPFELVTRLRLAGESVRQNRVVAEKVFALKNLRNAFEEKSRFLPDSPVLQLSRGEAFQNAAFAFRIQEFDTIFSQSSPSEMYLTLTDVAEAIAGQLKRSSYLMAYSGSGIYTCITRRSAECLTEDLCHLVQMAVDDLSICYDDGRPCPITMAMSQPQTKSRLFGGSPTDIITDAIEAVKRAAAPGRMATRPMALIGGARAEAY